MNEEPHPINVIELKIGDYLLHAINSDRQTRLLNDLGQTAMILGDKKSLVVKSFRKKNAKKSD